MRLPHWFRHAWGDWKPGTAEQGDLLMNYDYRNHDIRHCMLCGRRQMRNI